MAATKILFHPGASADYAEAFTWYYSHGTGIAFNFEREIEILSAGPGLTTSAGAY